MLQCEFSMKDWTFIGNHCSCMVKTEVMAEDDPLIVKEVRGNHLAGKSNTDVVEFSAYRQATTFIPKNIEKFFPNLLIFCWIDGELLKIDSKDLEPFPNLFFFDIGGNKIKSLDGNLFMYTRKLQTIYLDANQIQHVGRDLITGLEELLRVYFRKNVCMDFAASNLSEIQRFKELLPMNCPECAFSLRCSLNEENDILTSIVYKQINEVSDLRNKLSQSTSELSNQIEIQNEETRELRTSIQSDVEFLRSDIRELKAEIKTLHSAVAESDARIAWLEKIIKEIQIVP